MIKKENFHKNISPEKRDDMPAIGVIFLYCLTYALARFLISPTMELDEAEQFLHSTLFQPGYNNQPPLYNWIVKAVSSVFSLNLATLLFVKYSLLFCFYYVFYLAARTFNDSKRALLMTGSLMIFPLYSYEFNRDLSHSILVALMSCLTAFLYIRIFLSGKGIYYFLAGITIGFGVLSKYNYLVFLIALILASASCREGRRLIFNRRTLLAVSGAVLAILPHSLWLIKNNFSPFHFALEKSKIGELSSNSFSDILFVLGKSYLEVLIFLSIFAIFFYRPGSSRKKYASPGTNVFRLLSFYGLLIPLCIIIFLHTGTFKGRWLAPVLFTVPLAMFSMVSFELEERRTKLFGFLCIFIAAAILIIRITIGLMPDHTRAERIHIPFEKLSSDITGLLKDKGVKDIDNISIVTDDEHLAANISAWIPGIKFLPLQSVAEDAALQQEVLSHGGIVVWDTLTLGESVPKKFLKVFHSSGSINLLSAPYIHSKKQTYVLGVELILPKKANK